MANQGYKDVPIRQGQSIEGLAATYLGNAARWPELASLNNLRYPYVSEDPRDRAGLTIAATTIRALTRSLSANDTGATGSTTGLLAGDFVLPLAADLAVQRGMVALVLTIDNSVAPRWDRVPILGAVHAGSGGDVADSAVIAGLSAAQFAALPPAPLLVLDGSLTQAYAAGVEVSVHQDPNEAYAQVLGPGDYIRVPALLGGANLLGPNALNDLLGIDVALDPNGNLGYDDGGDLLLIGGVGNLHQALMNRLRTQPGELPLHADYGNALLLQIGRNAPETLVVANAEARQAILGDPRIASVSSSSATQYRDLLAIEATAIVDSVDQLLSVATIIDLGR